MREWVADQSSTDVLFGLNPPTDLDSGKGKRTVEWVAEQACASAANAPGGVEGAGQDSPAKTLAPRYVYRYTSVCALY
jgi:hypothetical protein